MGNGSPRLLSKFVRRTAAVTLVALYMAPSAFADDAVIAVSVSAGPVATSVAVAAPTAPPAPAAPAAPATPATPEVPVTPVASPLPSAHSAVQATVDAIVKPAPNHGAKSSAVKPAPRRILSPTKQPASRRAAALRSAGSSRIGAPVRGPLPQVPSAGSPVRGPAPRSPQLPAPAPSDLGFAGTSSTGGAPSLGFLLFALAAALAIARAPALGRRVSLLLAPPRPHAHLLQLERPD
jgi:hypothetical protein